MAITNIHSGQSFSSFIQPNINDNVNVRLDVQIAWINEGYYVHIPGGGIYEVVSKVVFDYVFKLIKPYANAGTSVSVDVIYPIPKETARVSTTYWKHYNFTTGETQIFNIDHVNPEVVRVLVNGVGLDPSQFNVEGLTGDGKIEILDELSNADYIDIYYEK